MATTLENLTAARDGAAAKLAAAMTGDYSDPIEFKPNSNGQNTFDRVSYVAQLMALIERLDLQISRHDVFEVTSEMTA